MSEHLEYWCKEHEVQVERSGAKCPIDDKYAFDRWCKKCRDWAGCMGPHTHCPKCDSPPNRHELRNHSLMWHDGDVFCLECDTRVRTWDAG